MPQVSFQVALTADGVICMNVLIPAIGNCAEGLYTMVIESRDAAGTLSLLRPIEFHIKPVDNSGPCLG